MKIAIVGCGALGSYYGARLCRSGAEVHFLLRSDFEAVQERGVHVVAADGEFTAYPRAARRPEDIGVSDLVVIGLKTTANHTFPQLVSPLVGARTAVLTLQNGLGNEEQLAALFGPERILGGLCFVCLNRVAPGRIVHTAHGRISLGEFQRRAGPRTYRIADGFRNAGVPCDVTDDLAHAHWEKLVWNIPFNGLGVAASAGYEAVSCGRLAPGPSPGPCLTTDRLLGEPRWERLVRELMHEVITAAQALRMNLPLSTADLLIQRTLEMGAYKASTLIDFERGLPLELDSLFLEPLRRARAASVVTPRLQKLCAVLEALDAPRRG